MFQNRKMLTVLAICGSLRKESFNRGLIKALPALAPSTIGIVEAPSIGEIPHYDGDTQVDDGFPAAAIRLAEAIRAADGIIVVAPEYNWSIPGVLKNAIDWLSRMSNQPFKDKPMALQSVAPGRVGGPRMQSHLRQVLACVDAQVFAKPEVYVTFAAEKIDMVDLRITDEPTRDIIRQQLSAFESFIHRCRAGSKLSVDIVA